MRWVGDTFSGREPSLSSCLDICVHAGAAVAVVVAEVVLCWLTARAAPADERPAAPLRGAPCAIPPCGAALTARPAAAAVAAARSEGMFFWIALLCK